MTTQHIQADANTNSSVLRQQRRASHAVPVMLFGLGMTAAFYLIAPRVPWTKEFVARYFCGHPLEYVSSTMFFVGVAILMHKLWGHPKERAALHAVQQARITGALTPAVRAGSAAAIEDMSARLQSFLGEQPEATRHSALGRRIGDTLQYVEGAPGSGLEEHLKYLAELAVDRLHQSYALLRTIAWAIPIIGFLGTVIGITMAIANITPEQLDSSLTEVSAGLAVAFDTTAQALAMSLVLVFGAFLTERCEQSVLNDVEEFGIDWLSHSLVREDGRSAAITAGAPAGADAAIEMMQREAVQWQKHLTETRSGWAHMMQSHSVQLTEAMQEELASTLQMHRESSEDARSAYAVALQEGAASVSQQLQSTMDTLTQRIDRWSNVLQDTTMASAAQSEELHRLGRTLLQLQESEERLAHLQSQLNENLKTMQVVETLEQSVSTLTAAIHFLSAKTNIRSAA